MKTTESSDNQQLSKVRELQMVCEIWIAANGAKDQRIHDLEEEVGRLQQRVARLSRRISRGKPLLAGAQSAPATVRNGSTVVTPWLFATGKRPRRA
ncbi:MAG: hypothetical protein JRH20_03710 [Deltaproteobacteria bacterium]|nr:hypothetical protein [Deltaproteobacteria bacterium]